MGSAKDLPDLNKLWDVAVVGTGMGGATLGQALAKQGVGVLFLEKGPAVATQSNLSDATTAAERVNLGWWPYPITQRFSDGHCERFFAAVGCAVGGSSIHYAAALERMAASDFESLQTSSQQLPAWPVSYDEFLPFYEAAEALYGLRPREDKRGEHLLSEWDRALLAAMRQNGLRPERLQVAMRYDDDCLECIGRISPLPSRAGARSACLHDAYCTPAAATTDHCEDRSLSA